MAEITEILPDEEVLYRFRPTLKSFWVFFAGIILVGGGPIVKPEGPVSLTTGIFVSVIFLIIILRRFSEVYVITDKRILTRGGLIERVTYQFKLEDIVSVEANQGLNLRLVGAGHILIGSNQPDQANLIMYGQDKPFQLKDTIDELIRQARQ